MEKETPVQTWTPEEWRAFLSEVEEEILRLKEKFPGQSAGKTQPRAEALNLRNAEPQG
jgi:hypothetical protein